MPTNIIGQYESLIYGGHLTLKIKLVFYHLPLFIEILNSPEKHPKIRNKTKQPLNRTKMINILRSLEVRRQIPDQDTRDSLERQTWLGRGWFGVGGSPNKSECKSATPTGEQLWWERPHILHIFYPKWIFLNCTKHLKLK